ncbi:lysylphosphatidylglycerol synthase domain-containing protein [Demequina sp.]|uniref:lysylphosphatidylglycerol synthase domain-containing protein n=1 Tax=Demequina sp. TaxID=2050685 RepID=UPI003D12DFED
MDTESPSGIKAFLRRRWVKPAAIVLVSLIVGWFIIRFIGKVSWSAVGDAIRSVGIWELLALVALLLVRQVVNAIPIGRFTPGLGLPKSVVSDVSANLAGTIAPPPGDVVVRIAQFRTWGINPVDGMAGATLNMLIFYGARFAAPALGAAIFCLYSFESGHVVTGVISLIIAIVIVAVLVGVLQSDAVAERLARRAARAATAMSAKVEEQKWVDAVVDFRRRIGKTLNRNLAPALLAMVAGIVADASIFLAAVRFVGIGADVAPWPVVVGAVLLAYPLTILPMFGLGVMDAVIIAAVVDVTGVEYESALVGAAMVWRVITLGGTLALGALAMAWWRAQAARAEAATTASGL